MNNLVVEPSTVIGRILSNRQRFIDDEAGKMRGLFLKWRQSIKRANLQASHYPWVYAILEYMKERDDEPTGE